MTAAEREEFLEALVEWATFIEPREEIRICRDAKDDKFLKSAVSSGAACLISGDKDLRSLNSFRGIIIATAAEFLAATEGKQDV